MVFTTIILPFLNIRSQWLFVEWSAAPIPGILLDLTGYWSQTQAMGEVSFFRALQQCLLNLPPFVAGYWPVPVHSCYYVRLVSVCLVMDVSETLPS